MCKVYNQIGCLTEIKLHLRQHNVNENLSPHELINFQNSYSATQQQIILDHKLLINQEKNTLSDQIIHLDHSIKAKKRTVKQQLLSDLVKLKNRLSNLPSTHSNIIQALINFVKKISLKLRIWINKLIFNFKIAYSLKHLSKPYTKQTNDTNILIRTLIML